MPSPGASRERPASSRASAPPSRAEFRSADSRQTGGVPTPWLQRVLLWIGLLVCLRLTAAFTSALVVTALLVLLLGPAAEALQRRGFPALAAAATVVFLPVVASGGLLLIGAPSALRWLDSVSQAVDHLRLTIQGLAVQHDPVGRVAGLAEQGLQAWRPDLAAWVAADGAGWAFVVASVLMLTFFLLMGQRSLWARLLRALPQRRSRLRLVLALEASRRGVLTYLATMAVINAGLGVATALVLWALGMPAVVTWAVVITLLLFVPYLGPVAIAALLATAGHAIPGAFANGLVAPLAFLLLHAIEAHFISPWATASQLRLGRSALLAAVIAGSWAWGITGGLLAVPLLIAYRAALRGAGGHRMARAVIAADDGNAPSLAASTAAALARDSEPSDAGSDDSPPSAMARLRPLGSSNEPPVQQAAVARPRARNRTVS
jgi:predicted PurR-regulated permease PerM